MLTAQLQEVPGDFFTDPLTSDSVLHRSLDHLLNTLDEAQVSSNAEHHKHTFAAFMQQRFGKVAALTASANPSSSVFLLRHSALYPHRWRLGSQPTTLPPPQPHEDTDQLSHPRSGPDRASMHRLWWTAQGS